MSAVDFDAAQAIIAAAAMRMAAEDVPLALAHARVLARDVIAAIDAPRGNVSERDGYAVRDADVPGPGTTLRIVGEAWPGQPCAIPIGGGEAVRIFTGAALPPGADRVIMQEHVARDDDVAVIGAGFGPGWHVRGAASDFGRGATLIAAGTRLSARALVAAGGADVALVSVAQQPRVAIIASGDELVPPGVAHQQAHAIPDSVTAGVGVLARSWGGRVVATALLPDELPRLRVAAADAVARADVVVAIGGASVGARDFAKAMFGDDLRLLFTKVAMRPGRPAWLGQVGAATIVGLPGNPTSAMVCARLFLAPLLAAMQGQHSPPALAWRRLPLATALDANDARATFVRATWSDAGLVPLADTSAGAQAALVAADWLIEGTAHRPALAAGTMVRAIAF